MLSLEYKPYYKDNLLYDEPYFLKSSNRLLEAVKESIINYGLVLDISDAIEIEIYKMGAVHELKQLINIISAENPTIFENLNGRFDIDILPAIEPKDHKTQAYNVIIEDIQNIIAIQKNNKKNIEKYFCNCKCNDLN